jgi:hypothetical protein
MFDSDGCYGEGEQQEEQNSLVTSMNGGDMIQAAACRRISGVP